MNGAETTCLPDRVMVAMGLVDSPARPVRQAVGQGESPQEVAIGLAVLVAAGLVIASGRGWTTLLVGVALRAVHTGTMEALLAAMVADRASGKLCAREAEPLFDIHVTGQRLRDCRPTNCVPKTFEDFRPGWQVNITRQTNVVRSYLQAGFT